MVLPSTACDCVKDFGPGRMSLPPLMWFVVGLGVLAYVWLSNIGMIGELLQLSGISGFLSMLMDFGNLFLVLNILGLITLWGGFYELRKRKIELEAKKPFMTCEQQ